MSKKWIQKVFSKKRGALHKQLGYPQSQTLPKGLLKQINQAKIGTHVRGHKVTSLLWHRVHAVVNAQKRRK